MRNQTGFKDIMFPTSKSPVKGGLLSSIYSETRMWKVEHCEGFEGSLYTFDEVHYVTVLWLLQLRRKFLDLNF